MIETLAANVVVSGEPLKVLPQDLYIPPGALLVLLEQFTGPLDLLLYLIRKQQFDILNIPIAMITEQYMAYIALLNKHSRDLAAEYLVMAALLAEIKSRLLLPKLPEALVDEQDTDPRIELVKRLQRYEQFKNAAQQLDEQPRMNRDFFQVHAQVQDILIHHPVPDVELDALVSAMISVIRQQAHRIDHEVVKEALSVHDRIEHILLTLVPGVRYPFNYFFSMQEGRQGLIVTLLAILELAKTSLISIQQSQPFEPIFIEYQEKK